jgi:hypothetical protein
MAARLPPRPRKRHTPFLPILASVAIGSAALASIVYLLQPAWQPAQSASEPATLPVTIGHTLFNVPTASIRVKLQKRTGPQEQVDMSFRYPSLEPPTAQKHITAAEAEAEAAAKAEPIDRIFVSLIAHHDAISPEERAKTIYPRYLESDASTVEDTLMVQAFRAGTPYAGEDLYMADGASFTARCSRDAQTPGMCLSERRVGDADIHFRFPRAWLAHWRDVADAMDKLADRLQGPGK